MTTNQLLKSARKQKRRLVKSKQLDGCAHKKGICLRVYVAKPKKPNSAIRKVARIRLTGTDKTLIVYIPGQGHNLKQFSAVLIRGGRVKDLPGVHYHAVRGKYDFSSKENIIRNRARSKYGLSKLQL